MKLDYFIVLVAPDAESLVGRHQFFQAMVQSGRLNDIVRLRTGQNSIQGNLSLARTAQEAVETIDRNYKYTEDAVQIVCADYRVNPALGDYGSDLTGRNIQNGLDLTDYLRWNFVGKKNGLCGFRRGRGPFTPSSLPQ
ncbi:hypothetical protein SAMN02745216_02602 [Desulfatibacillum alkenivorans DSM 16219]|jgi:hypothetical protein|uniref:Uncharacterized protein n=1 Tax=Desulfatibacillum alkenivorans DSM 16219 TaxID=1121393 RepID=A0A1M6NJ16_9BACT|nr:hypothetical protein [Desulfatibacillum alkenivorans]SHJ95680.1 hypothetical protein SAMN02745216_02602 [Desulfatibacillum alkenivorans DSM 16219]